MKILELTEGDTRPLVCRYQAGGKPVDITGYSFVLKIKYADSTLNKAGSITDAIGGWYEFQWLATDLKQGLFDLEIMVTNAAGQEETSKRIKAQIKGRL